jgi:hypothetical protein
MACDATRAARTAIRTMQKRSHSTTSLLVLALLALVGLVWAGLTHTARGPVAAHGLGRADDAGATASDAPGDGVELVTVDGAAREALAPTLPTPAERNTSSSAALVSVLVRRVDQRLASPGVEGVRVWHVGVGRRHGPAAPLGVTDARGELRAALPGSGRYELFVDPSDVPRGLVAPGRFLVPGPTALGVTATFVEVMRGSVASAVLYLSDARALAGRLLGPGGDGLAGVHLRAAATAAGHQRVSYDFDSGEDGVFALHGALPLEYVLRVVDLGAHAAALRALPRPPPQLVDLQPGDVRGIELRVSAGRHLITGTIIDERGAPFPGIDLLAYYRGLDAASSGPRAGAYDASWSDLVGTAISDAHGRFELGPVHSANLRLVVGPQAASAGGRGARLLAFGIDPLDIALDASAAARIDIGQLELTRSRTYSVSGSITLAPSESGTKQKLSKLEVTAAALVPPPSLAGRWGVQTKPHVTFDPVNGSFELSCDGWHERMELVVAWRGQPSSEKRFDFVPEPDGDLAGVSLTFP